MEEGTTTISTIAVQSGSTKIVIALLQVKQWLELRVLEVTPGLTLLGDDLGEATAFRNSHYDVIQKVQSKKSPVEELLRQADEAMEREGGGKTRVYAAMADSLTAAWNNVQAHLDTRRNILDINVEYHRCATEFEENCKALEKACSGELPIEIEELREAIERVGLLERQVLYSVNQALHQGASLLDILQTIREEGTLDSRPGQIKLQAELAKCQVERWLEGLHERRGQLARRGEETHHKLEGCLSLAIITSDLTRLHRLLEERTESLLRSFDQLGDAHASAQLLLHEHRKLVPEAKELQEQALKIVKATEEFASAGHFAGPEAISQAYCLLESAATYLHHIDHRESNLLRSIDFFNNAHSALIKLDQLEVQLTTGDLGLNPSQLEQLHSNIARSLEEVTASPLQEGYSLLQDVPGAEGVKRMVELMENKKINLSVQCTAHQEENIKANRVYNNFIEKYEKLSTWLMSMENYVTSLQDLGSNLSLASDFLQIHRKNLNDLEVKGNEIHALINSIPSISESLTDSRRDDVLSKGEALRKGWQELRKKLEDRVSLGGAYVRALELATRLTSELDSLEASMKEPFDEARGREASTAAQQIEPQLANTCSNFAHDFKKNGGGGVDGEQGSLRLQTTLEHLSSRHQSLQTAWSLWLQEREQTKAAWDINMAAANKTIDLVSKLDAHLYPILNEDLVSARQLASLVEERHNTVLPEIRRAQQEIQSRIQSIESFAIKGGNTASEGISQRLKELNNKLQTILMGYQLLLEKLLTFFNGLSQVENRVEAVKREDKTWLEPFSAEEANKQLREFEVTRHTISEMLNLNIIESGHLIAKIRSQDGYSEKDVRAIENSIEHLRTEWENLSEHRWNRLEQEGDRITFRRDLTDIRRSLDQLALRLNTYTNYGDSLAQAVTASNAFTIFEKTIQELEIRILRFTKIGEERDKDEAGDEINQLRREWESLKEQVNQTRNTIDLTVQYFKLVEESEEWFREGNRLLLVIARKANSVRSFEQASELLAEIEAFVKPGEQKQYQRINEISDLAQQLQCRGSFLQMTQVQSDSKEMLDSFSQVSSDLKTLCEKLQNPEPIVELMETDGAHKTDYITEDRHTTQRVEFTSTTVHNVIHKIEIHQEEAMDALPPKDKPVEIEFEEKVREKKSPSPPLKKVRYQEEKTVMESPYFTLTLQDTTIEEGSKFTFNCRVTGIPIPEVVWEKDGISIDNNPDYETNFEDGLCSLTIEETFAEDSASFTCRASNAAGSAQTSARLFVKESTEQTFPPVFVLPVNCSTVMEGGTIRLRCRVDGMPLPTVQWFTGSGTSLENNPNYSIIYNNGEATIEKLTPAALEDEGVYYCTAYNKLGTETSMARLMVTKKEVIPEGKSPVFTLELGSVMARTGEKIKLECEASGNPMPAFRWAHEGKSIKETSDSKVITEGSKSTLVINEAFPKHAGLYKVIATNSAGSEESCSQVTVKGRLPAEESDSEQPSDMEPTRPNVQLHLKDLSIFEGKKVRLDCVIVGHPEPEVIWYHNEKPVKESTDIQLTFQGDRCSLIIKEALLEDAGHYKVVAINSAGEASSGCNLSVQPIDKSGEHATRNPVEKEPEEKSKEGEPKFTKMLTDLLVAQGDTLTLEVEVTGSPMPTVTWALNNQDLQQSERIHMSQENEGKCQLRISIVEAGDKGVYTAKASNQLGEAKCFAQLIVKTPLAEAPQTAPPEVTKHPPAFMELFADRAVPEGSSTKFECIVTGKPTPKIRWLFNDAPVSGKDFLVSTSGNRQVLTVTDVTMSHFGKVTCSAENEAGKTACSAVLSVIESELESTFPSIDNMNLQESCKFEMKKAVFMQSSTSQFSSSSSVSGAEPVVQVKSMSSKSHMASQKIGDSPAVQVEKHETSEYSNVGGVESRSESHIVKSTDSVEAQSGKSIITKQQRKSTPPRFISPLTGCIIDQGTDVSLQAIVDGYPTPTVTWTKNGSQEPPPKAEISWELGKASMKISNVSTSEGGRYTCTATNPAGTAASTADIVVRKSSFPPVMGKRLQGTSATVGQRVCLEVEVTGTPTPTITWTKDNKVIPTDSPKYRLQSFGNSHSLVIDRAESSDSGEYGVSAKNSAGEARSMAELLVMQEAPSSSVLYKTTVMELESPKLISQPILKPVHPVPFQPISPHFEEVASPGVKPRPLIDLKPGSPPKMDYAPPPAGYSETSNSVSFAEATQSSRRVVSMQQTTRVLSFDKGKKTVQSSLPSKIIAQGDAKWATDSESELEELRRTRASQQLRPGEPPQYHYAHPPQAAAVASKHMTEMSSAFKSKAQQFVSDVIKDVKQPTFPAKEIVKKEEPQIYREESRLAEHGKKHIDPETGLIYFKYDFGYEFGVVLPGEGGGVKKTIKDGGISRGKEKEEGSIDVPVIHETTKPQFKAVKWEPTSETELSEAEDIRKGKQGRMFVPATPSPCSISPSLPSLSPYPCHHDQQVRGQSWTSETSSPYFYNQSSPVVNAAIHGDLPKRAPIFITPLRDIAVVSGQTARFECIAQAEPAPNITWAKDGQQIQPSREHQVHFRNGVCRLTLPQAFQYDAGIYTCTASNSEGSKETSANLKVSGEERTFITK